jgi:hypothetical protein
LPQFQPQVKAGSLPGYPADLAIEQFLRDGLAVFGRRNGNGRIRMQVVDMGKRKKAMQGVSIEGALELRS